MRIAIVGGGISGLTAAHRVRRLLPRAEIQLFEASDRLGGPLHTLRTGDALLEQGADSFLIKTPWALELCRDLDLADKLVPTNEHHRRALVARNGKLLPVPDGFVLMRPQNVWAMIKSPVLSPLGKLRLLAEPLVRVPETAHQLNYDESVASFATRRLGRETYERLVQPLVAGIFVADARKLSLAATFPEFLQAEREQGSLLRRAPSTEKSAEESRSQQKLSGARYGQFVTLKGGMSTLVEALAKSLGDGVLRLRTPVERVSRSESNESWAVTLSDHASSEQYDGVILATGTPRTATLISAFDPLLSGDLAQIEYASSAVATLVYRRDRVSHPLDGFGAVVPTIENRPIIAASFLTTKFPHAAPADQVAIRVFMGGVLRPELVDCDDNEIAVIAKRELEELVGASGAPFETHVARWRQSMPQYHVGHLELVAAIERRVNAHRGLELTGSGYRGVGIPQCVQQARAAAERLVQQLAPTISAAHAPT